MRRLFISVSMLGAILDASAALKASSNEERGFELFDFGRNIDAQYTLREARKTRGAKREQNVPQLRVQNLDYALTLASTEEERFTALELFAAFEDEYPEAPYQTTLDFLRALIFVEEQNYEAAINEFSSVELEQLSKEQREQYHIRLGYIYFSHGDYGQSVHHLTQIPEDSKYYIHVLYMNSYIDYVEKNYKSAREGFARLEERDIAGVYSKVLPFYIFQIDFAEGKYREAINKGLTLYEGADKKTQQTLARAIAEAYFRLGDSEKTLSYINAASPNGGTRYEFYIKGFSLHQLRRYEEAAQMLRKACGADDAMTQNASFHLANCYIHMGDKQGALEAFSMAANDKFNAQIAEEALFNAAKLNYELGSSHFNETINLLSRYINEYDNLERRQVAQTLLVAAYYNLKDYEAAYENIAKIKEPDAEIRAAKQRITYLRALEAFKAGDFASSERYLEESIEIGVTQKYVALAKFWLGDIAQQRGEYQKALDLYNNFLARSPKSEPTRRLAEYNIAYILLHQENMSSAEGYFRTVVRNSENSEDLRGDSYLRMGDINYEERDFSSAISNYGKGAWLTNGDKSYGKYQIAIIQGIQGRDSEKIKTLKQILELEKGAYLDDASYQLGRTYLKMGQYKNAIGELDKYVAKYPSAPLNAQALSDIAVSYINLDNAKQALTYYDKSIKAAPQSAVAKNAMEGVREIYIGRGDAPGYFKYAEKMGMEGDLTAVKRDSLSFASARGLYLAGTTSQKQQRAATTLDAYVNDYPKGYYVGDALFYLSDTYLKLKQNDRAIETLEKLAERGQSQYSQKLYSTLAELTYEKGDYAKSAKASRELYNLLAIGEERQAAMLAYAESTLLTKDEVLLREMSADILAQGEEKAGREATIIANYLRATSLRERGERAQALALYEQLAKGDSKYRSEASYYVIEDLQRRGKRKEAQEEIFKFSESEGTNPYWLARTFILLGDLYALEGDNFQARATYQSIVDGYSDTTDGIIDEAKQKISLLSEPSTEKVQNVE